MQVKSARGFKCITEGLTDEDNADVYFLEAGLKNGIKCFKS